MKKYEVLLLVDAICDLCPFEEHLKKEGFLPVENEELAYVAYTDLPIMNTRAFIFETLKNAFKLSNTHSCIFACKLGENPAENYLFDEETNKKIEELC